MPSHTDSLAIIVPYRDRESHLKRFVPYMEEVLSTVPHRYIVVEQRDARPFNKGRLLNIGFRVAAERTSCVCFHDVDMLPLDGPEYYTPPERTTHIAGRIEQFGYVLPYPEYLGGVFLTSVSDFCAVNGFSNEYWGWGNEDDDIFVRYRLASIEIRRKPGRYLSLPHSREPESMQNTKRLMGTLAAVPGANISTAEQKRLCSLQNGFRHALGIDIVEPISCESDGLTTLVYEECRRMPLREAFSFPGEISDVHELVRVVL